MVNASRNNSRKHIFLTAALICLILTFNGCIETHLPEKSPEKAENDLIITPKINEEATPAGETVVPEFCTPVKTGETDKIDPVCAALNKSGTAGYADVVFTAVAAGGSACTFCAYSYKDGGWNTEFQCAGFIGRNGLAEGDKKEGDGKTPCGIYPLGMAFGIDDKPENISVDYTKVTDDLYWDCDVNSLYYNSPVYGSDMPEGWDREASERLADHKGSYDYSVEIRYNTEPVVAGLGSAIFLHCTRKTTEYTLGCVAIPKQFMEKTLELMTEKSCIMIARDVEKLTALIEKADPKATFTGKKSNDLPDGFTYITDLIPNAVVDIRYFGTNNFTGRRVNGYEANVAISTEAFARNLYRAAEQLFADGYKLVIYDAYRPARAVDDFIAWGRDTEDTVMKPYFYPDYSKEELFSYGYISSRSRHSRGSAADISIVRLDGTPVEMGGTFDFFGDISHHGAQGISAEASENRDYLKSVMENAGLTALHTEWWHYYLKDEPYKETYFDFPVR